MRGVLKSVSCDGLVLFDQCHAVDEDGRMEVLPGGEYPHGRRTDVTSS